MKKNKFLIYTSNLDTMPKSMADVVNFAERNDKYMIANVELNSCLANVKEGDNIFTKKGNSLYVIRTFQDSLEDLPGHDSEYIENLTRMGKLKKVNITSVSKIVDFTTWCKTAKPLIRKSSKEMKNNSIDSMMDRIKNMFQPSKAEGVRLAMTDGSICVETAEGFIAIDANNNLVSYPEDLTMEVPVYIICKPKDQLKVGDIIKTGKSYAKVTKIEGEKINAISYTGTGKVVHTIKDFLFNQTMVRVVVSLTNMAGGQINPMVLMAMSKSGGKKSSMLPFLAMMNGMGQQNNAGAFGGLNPMIMMAMGDKDDEFSLKDLFMLSAMSGQNMFGGMFGGNNNPQAPVQ